MSTKKMRAVCEFDGLPYNDSLVLEGLITLMLTSAIAPPTAGEIAAEVGIDRKEVVESLKSLCESGFTRWPAHPLRSLTVNIDRLSLATA